MPCITRHLWALLVTGLLSGSHIPCGASAPPPEVMRLSLAFARADDFDRFVSLAPRYNEGPEFDHKVLMQLLRDCNILVDHKIPTATIVSGDLFARIESGMKEKSIPEGYEKDPRFLLVKRLNRDQGLDESDYLEMGHVPYLCIIKIPEFIFPPEGTDFFDYLREENDVSALLVEVGVSIENDCSMVFVKNGSGIVWGNRKHP